MYNQQGDVLMFKVDSKPKGLKKVKSNLVHKGNSHNHTLTGNFRLYETKELGIFIVANENCKLVHPEHKTIKLSKGIYKKEIVLEYDHFLEESRQVID